MITAKYDNIIPEDQRQRYLADGAKYLARATHRLAESGGIPPEEKKKAGEEAIVLARKALEIHTQMYGVENSNISTTMTTMKSFVFTSKQLPSLFAHKVVCLRMWRMARTIWAWRITTEQSEHKLPMIWINV